MVSDIWMEYAGEVAQKAFGEAERILIMRFGTAQPEQIIATAAIVAQAFNAFMSRQALSMASAVHDRW